MDGICIASHKSRVQRMLMLLWGGRSTAAGHWLFVLVISCGSIAGQSYWRA